MSITAYNRRPINNWQNYRFNFKVFKSSEDFIKEIVDINESEGARFKSRTSFDYYYDTMKYQNVVDYSSLNKLDDMLNNFENLYDQIDMGGAFKKKKLLITDDKRGIFSFSIASKGLYRGVEYYSEEIKIDNPIELTKYNKPLGVVMANLVESIIIGGEKQFQYKSTTNNKVYPLTRQQEGTANVIEANPSAIIKETSGGIKYPEPQSFGNVGIKFKTSTKKSYLMFDKKGGKAEMVELYIPIHANYDLENALPVFLIAKYLVSMGIKVRISAIRMYHEDTDYFFMWSLPIKDYGDEMDFNKMALVGVDNRWWNLVQVGVKTLELKRLGYSVNGSGNEAGNEADYVEAFSRYRNWYEEQIKLGLIEPLKVDKKLIMIAGLIQINGYQPYEEQVMAEFYRVMDRIDFYYNKSDKVIERIYKREVEKKAEESFVKDIEDGIKSYQQAIEDDKNLRETLISQMKIYVQQVLSDTYTYPKGGEFPESKESAEMMEDEFDKKIEEMNKYLKSL
jgi:hypothetical protein